MTSETYIYHVKRDILLLTEARRLIVSAIENLRLAGPGRFLSLIETHEAILNRVNTDLKACENVLAIATKGA